MVFLDLKIAGWRLIELPHFYQIGRRG